MSAVELSLGLGDADESHPDWLAEVDLVYGSFGCRVLLGALNGA